ncbi:MAG TPA: luciferase family protein [Nitrososphaeraceae archaeon]|nr:luciferase family protein [Nitrososphaeraceae archaeon]
MILEKIRKEILSWPNVTAEQHKFGGVEFRLNKREIGHIHGDRLADLPFPMKTRNELVSSGRASPHHVMPQSGWVSYWIEKGEEDVATIIRLFRLRYEQQLKPKSLNKQEEKVQEGGSNFDDYTYGCNA